MTKPEPLVEFDPFSAETVANPYPTYHRLHEEEPLQWSPIWQAWIVSRYQDVRAALGDDRFSARHSVQQLGVAPGLDLGLFGRIPGLPSTDPPLHTRLRKLVNRAFTPLEVERLRGTIEAIVEDRLAAAAERGEMHLVEDIAGPLPTLAIARMLGVPMEDAGLFKQWSDDLVVAFEGTRATPEQLDAIASAARNLDEYLTREVRTRAGSATDLLVRLRDASEGDDALSEEEVVSTCILLLVAGNETTTSLITNGMYALFEHPDQMARLHRDAAVVPTAIEEFLRYYGPVHMVIRKATEDIEIAGGVIPKKDAAVLLIGAADRDFEQFPDADTLMIDRTPNDHLAFGRARHFCLGAPLARLEAQSVFDGFLRHFDDWQLDDDEPPVWHGALQARRINELHLRLTPKRTAT
jgi:cytochrome P450